MLALHAPQTRSLWNGSLFEQVEWWIVRQYDRMADNRERRASAALLDGLDERTLADIGYGVEDVNRVGHR